MYINKEIHIGHQIKEVAKHRNLSMAMACEFFNCKDQDIEHMYQQKSIDSYLLLQWSKLLDYNFFISYHSHLQLHNPLTTKSTMGDEEVNSKIAKTQTESIVETPLDFQERLALFFSEVNLTIMQLFNQFQVQYFNRTEDVSYDTKQKEITPLPKILVVDDDQFMLHFYKHILTSSFDCDFVSNGSLAINLIKENNYQCIVTDIVMPDIDGFKLIEIVNKEMKGEFLPVIFVTANYIEKTKIDAFRIGVHDFITKPFIVKELIVRIHNVIRNNKNRVNLNTLLGSNNLFNVSSDTLNDDKNLLSKIISTVDDNLSDPNFTIDKLAESVFYSSRQLTRKTKELTGLTPSKLIMERRLIKAEHILKTSTNIRISDVQNLVGINSTSYFNRAFKERFGITPRDLKSK